MFAHEQRPHKALNGDERLLCAVVMCVYYAGEITAQTKLVFTSKKIDSFQNRETTAVQ